MRISLSILLLLLVCQCFCDPIMDKLTEIDNQMNNGKVEYTVISKDKQVGTQEMILSYLEGGIFKKVIIFEKTGKLTEYYDGKDENVDPQSTVKPSKEVPIVNCKKYDIVKTDDEIAHCIELGKKYNIELILQPQTVHDKPCVSSENTYKILITFLKKYDKVRLIPQVHKFLGVE